MLVLRRFKSEPYGTFGAFWRKDDNYDGPYALTVEPETPKIPPGDYVLRRYKRPSNGVVVYRFENDTDPSIADHCWLIHIGNTSVDTTGCICPGVEYGPVTQPSKAVFNRPGVLYSQVMFERLMSDFSGDISCRVE
jgi:hypothetical protein